LPLGKISDIALVSRNRLRKSVLLVLLCRTLLPLALVALQKREKIVDYKVRRAFNGVEYFRARDYKILGSEPHLTTIMTAMKTRRWISPLSNRT